MFQEYVNTITEAAARLTRLLKEIEHYVNRWRMAPVVEALMALRGVQMIVAVTMVSELGDITRFKSPTQLMSYLGLTPSEHSSGERQRRGGITKTGNRHARRVLVEAAWAYRFMAKVSPAMQKRQENLPLNIRDIAWKAQVRLCKRYRLMAHRGKPKNVIVVSIARELAGFMWDIAHQTPVATE